MFESYDNDYNTMYRYYYGSAVTTYKMSTHTRFPESEFYNQGQLYLVNNPPATMFIEPVRNTCVNIISSHKEDYSEDEWKVLSDAIAQEGQRLLEEEQEERFLWQEPRPIQENLSLIIPKDDDDDLTDDDDCQDLTDDDEQHEKNTLNMANVNCYDDSSSQESTNSWLKWTRTQAELYR